MLNSKLKAIIYNVQARDEYSVDLPSYGQCQWAEECLLCRASCVMLQDQA